jgi:hypothetical protein
LLDQRLRLLDGSYANEGGLFRGKRVLDVGCNCGRVVGELGEFSTPNVFGALESAIVAVVVVERKGGWGVIWNCGCDVCVSAG